jgi:cytochrome c-type biogenesis protein CcmH
VPAAVQQRVRTDSLDNAELVQALEKRLKCTCGCNLDVFTCRTTDFTCTTSPSLHADVLARLRADGGGMTQASAERVVQAFVAQYGQSILMQPPKVGFNWTAYVMPFFALMVGLGLVAAWLRADGRMGGRADGKGEEGSAQPPIRPSAVTADDADRLRRELEQVDS